MWAVYKKAKEKQLIGVQWHTIKMDAQMSWRSWKNKHIYIHIYDQPTYVLTRAGTTYRRS